MCTNVNHNYGVPTGGIPPMLAVPLAGPVKITVKDLNGKLFGETKSNPQGEWRQTFCLDDGTYVVEFTGVFRPIGTGFKAIYNQPVTSTSITIAVPLTAEIDPIPPEIGVGPPGPAGAIGPIGIQGESGPSGPSGPIGADGEPGPSGVGTVGPSGPEGPSGPGGPEGVAGAFGGKGDQGQQGFTGNAGPVGPPGADGAAGSTGPVGPVGDACDLDIGTPTDGYISDGLLEWETTTKVCDALDDLNELMAALAPPAAPNFSDITIVDSGTAGKVSFGTSNAIAGYTDVGTAAGGSALDINGSFVNSGQRKGIFNATTTMNGVLADSTAAHAFSYPADSFGDGDTGTLNLIVNGSTIQSADLSSFGSGNSFNGNNSGFNLSAATSIEFEDTTPLDLFKYRTGTWVVEPADQRNGWNYMQVTHTVDGTDRESNFFEWVVDDTDVDTVYSALSFSGLSLPGTSQFFSGVEFHTGTLTATFNATASNAYRDTYNSASNAVNHPTDLNCSITDTSIPNMTLETDTIVVGKTCTLDQTRVILNVVGQSSNYGFGVSARVERIFSGNESTSSTTTDFQFCYDNASATSAALSNGFDDEDRRLEGSTNDFDTDLSFDWTKTESIVDAGSSGYTDGLQSINSQIIYPSQNFSTIADGPVYNEDYSTGVTGTRYYFGYFTNASGASNFRLTISGSATLIAESASLGTSNNNIQMSLRMPTQTGWLDTITSFIEGKFGSTAETYNGYDSANDPGCFSSSLGTDTTIPTTNLGITFGTKTTSNSFDKIYYRFAVGQGWTGNITAVSIIWGAT